MADEQQTAPEVVGDTATVKDYSPEILQELKELNKFLRERAEAERLKQDAQEAADQEAARVKQEQAEVEKLHSEENAQREAAEEEALVNFRKEVLEAIKAIEVPEIPDNSEQFQSLDNKLVTLTEQQELTPEQKENAEISKGTDLAIVLFLGIFLPAFLTVKGLGRLFEAASA